MAAVPYQSALCVLVPPIQLRLSVLAQLRGHLFSHNDKTQIDKSRAESVLKRPKRNSDPEDTILDTNYDTLHQSFLD